MSENKSQLKRSLAMFTVVAWMVVNVIFMILELTLFGDSADLNNSILLIFWSASIIGLLSLKKIGAAFATFSVVYAFSFNAFNVIYFPQVRTLNGVSAIINAVALIYMFATILTNKYR